MEEDIKMLKNRIEYHKFDPEEDNGRVFFMLEEIDQLENILNRLEQDERVIKGQEKTIEEQIEKIEQLNKELLQYQDLERALQDYYGITREDLENSIKEDV